MSGTCSSVEVVARPDLQLSCTSEFVPTQVFGRCAQQPGADIFLCDDLVAGSDVTLRPATP